VLGEEEMGDSPPGREWPIKSRQGGGNSKRKKRESRLIDAHNTTIPRSKK